MSRVLLVGVAVAGAAATTSAFTASNTFTGLDNNVAGYGELAVSGVNVSNIAYNPVTNDATRLQSVIFTVDRDTSTMPSRMSLFLGINPTPASSSTCVYAFDSAHKITCTLGSPVSFTSFDKTGLTVASD